MGHRLSKIYTRTGDNGSTGLSDGNRIRKDCARMEAIGTIDELNSVLGVLLAYPLPPDIHDCLLDIQHDLFDLGGELSMPGHTFITATLTEKLEQALDRFNADLPYLKEFILPGGSLAAATCHQVRTVCRRAERRTITLHNEEPINPHTLTYLNRLSDLLFVVARVLARSDGGEEILWQRERS